MSGRRPAQPTRSTVTVHMPREHRGGPFPVAVSTAAQTVSFNGKRFIGPVVLGVHAEGQQRGWPSCWRCPEAALGVTRAGMGSACACVSVPGLSSCSHQHSARAAGHGPTSRTIAHLASKSTCWQRTPGGLVQPVFGGARGPQRAGSLGELFRTPASQPRGGGTVYQAHAAGSSFLILVTYAHAPRVTHQLVPPTDELLRRSVPRR